MESLRTVTPGKMLLNMLNNDLFRAEIASMASAFKIHGQPGLNWYFMTRTPSRSDWPRSWSRNDSSVTWPCRVATRLTKKISLCITPRTETCRFAYFDRFDSFLRNFIWWCVSFKISPVRVKPLWPGQHFFSQMNNEELQEFFSLKSWSGFAAPSPAAMRWLCAVFCPAACAESFFILRVSERPKVIL